MQCPSCFHPLKILVHHGVEVDFCLSCGGTFFDDGELQEYLQSSLALSDRDDVFYFDGQVLSFSHPGEKERNCPRCRANLHPFNYTYDPHVILDRCEGCRGIWADGGEVQRLANSLKHFAPTQKQEPHLSSLEIFGDFSHSLEAAPWNIKGHTSLFKILPRALPPEGNEKEVPSTLWMTPLLIFTHFLALAFLIGNRLWSTVELPVSLGPIHEVVLALNIYFISLVGGSVERRLGSLTYLFHSIFLLSMGTLLGGYFTFREGPAWLTGLAALGPGLLGSYFLLFPSFRLRTIYSWGRKYRLFSPSFIWPLLIWVLADLILAGFIPETWSHFLAPQLAGFWSGIIVFLILRLTDIEKSEIREMALE